MLLNVIFAILFIADVATLIWVSRESGWNIARILLFAVLLPICLAGCYISGMRYVAIALAAALVAGSFVMYLMSRRGR